MRARGSLTGPLIIIAIGVVFLLHAISPQFPVAELLASYWPYVLIAWGVIALLEVCFRTFRGASVPVNGVSGGGWLAVILICVAGLAATEFRNPDLWWRNTDWSRGLNNTFGEEHDYSIDSVTKNVGSNAHIVIENFRGDAKVTGTDSQVLSVSGHKSVRAFDIATADRANTQTPVSVTASGNTVTIHVNQNRAGGRTSVETDLDISVPKGASIEASGASGDFDISALSGDVALKSGNAGVRLDDVGGNVSIETRRSDIVRCTNVRGAVDLRGHGSDVELTKIDGQVTVVGDYTGTVSLHELNKPVRLENMHTDLQAQQVMGEVRLDRGSLSIQDVMGPVSLTAHSTDVTLEGVTNALDISLDRGDVDLKPGRVPLSKIAIHAGSGNIELALPQSANFALNATTGHGEIDNQFGDDLKEQTAGSGASLTGSVGNGPEVNLATGRGSITVRKSDEHVQAKVASSARQIRDVDAGSAVPR